MSLTFGQDSEWQGNLYRRLERRQPMLLCRQTVDYIASREILKVVKISDKPVPLM